MTDVCMDRPTEPTRLGDLTDPPKYMQPGSFGPACALPAQYLNRWASKLGNRVYGVGEDSKFTSHLAECMEHYQRSHAGLSVDGGFGPETRRHMKETYGFDFLADARELGRELTCFLQPAGEEHPQLWWAPGIIPAPERETAEARILPQRLRK